MSKNVSALALAVSLAWAGPALAQEKAEVIHWWTSGGEFAAVKVFADQYTKTGGTWVDTAIAGGANARTAAINRTVGGTPPTMMQFNTGKQFDELVENGLSQRRRSDRERAEVERQDPRAIVQAAVTRNGKMFAVPVNIHGQNWIFYNTDGAEEGRARASPRTGRRLRGAGQDQGRRPDPARVQRPEDLGAQPVQRRHARTGRRRKLWQAVYGNKDAAAREEPGVQGTSPRPTASCAAIVDAGAPGRNWNDATSAGDPGQGRHSRSWATGPRASSSPPARPPARNMAAAILSNKGTGGYVMGGDVFAFPKTKDPPRSRRRWPWRRCMLDPETQITFNTEEGLDPGPPRTWM